MVVLLYRVALAAGGFLATYGGEMTTPLPSGSQPDGLPPFGPALRDALWRRAGEEVEALGESSVTSNQEYVCGSGTWGDGPQCNQWDQGHSPCWPSAMTISASWDTELMARWSKEMAQEFGLPNRGQLAPGVNLARYAWNGRLGEYMAGEDPFFGAKMVSAMVTAYRQVPTPPLQTVKHFIPNTIEKERMSMTEVVDERTLFEVYYPPFQAAVEAGVSGVMCSYNLVNCTSGRCSAGTAYACANDDILNKHLKDEMGFKGIVISDWDATKCQPEAANSGGCSAGSYVQNDFAAEAGLDLEMPACMSFSGGVTTRAKEKAQRMMWAYMVQNRSFGNTRTGRNRGWYADGVHRRLGEKTSSSDDDHDDDEDEDEYCCWWPRHSSSDNACAACKSKDRKDSREHCTASSGTWCRGGQEASAPEEAPAPEESTTEKPKTSKPARKPWTPTTPAHQKPRMHRAWTPARDEPKSKREFPDYAKLPVDFPPLCPDVGGENYKSECKLALADRVIAESTVVLKNEDGVLPLSKTANVALVGAQACAADPLAIGGGSGWNGMACQQTPKVNVQKGIQGLEDGPSLACPNNGADNSEAEHADIVLAVVVPAKACEGQDRATLQLEDEDVQLIKKYSAMGKKVVVAMNAPGPMITSTWDGNVSALLVSWLPGVQNGRGIAIALYNEGYEASGRLPFTFPKCSTAECSMADELASVALGDKIANDAVRVFTDKALIGYRWYHAYEKPVSYPFGFGLFAYGSAEVRYSRVSVRVDTSGAHLTAHLGHSGPRSGRDVPQLYLKFPKVPGDAASRPEWVLKGFEKVLVRPGAMATATFHVTVRDLSWWDDSPGQSRWVCASGAFHACVGANAQDAISGKGACTSFTAMCPAGSATRLHVHKQEDKEAVSIRRRVRRVLAKFDLARVREAAGSATMWSPAVLFLGAVSLCFALAAAAFRRHARTAGRSSDSNSAHVRLPLWAGETEELTTE